MSAAEARAAWLEREIASLKQVSEEDSKGNAFQRSAYWSTLTWRDVDQCGDRAWQEGKVFRDRAQHGGADLRRGRGEQSFHGHQGDGRAFKEYPDGQQVGDSRYHGRQGKGANNLMAEVF